MYNREFFTIDTEEKAYFLGQAFGDGYNKATSPYKFSLASIDSDTELYSKLSLLFPFLKLKQYKSHTNMIYLECHQKQFCIDLGNLGLNSNKTNLDKTFEFHFPEIRPELVRHFIRGYFDSDGSAWYPKRFRSRNNLRIGFGCSTKNFLLAVKKVLDDNGIYFTYTERNKKASNGKYYISYNLFSSNYETSIKFANFIYKDATIFLDYKHDICYREKILRPKASELFGNCPYCNSDYTIKRGKRGKNIRLYCKECGKGFSRPMPN